VTSPAARWLVAVLGVATGSFLTAGYMSARQDRTWFELDGRDWIAMDAPQRVAWTQGFLAGRAVGQVPDSVARDTIAFAQDLNQLRRGGALAFPYAPSLYVSRMGDYYYWENHRSHPLWWAMQDVNGELKR
jgi:hypothetical protein